MVSGNRISPPMPATWHIPNWISPVFLLCLANFPFWLAQSQLSLVHPIFNPDYLLVFALPSIHLRMAFIVGIWILEILTTIVHTYYFDSIIGLLKSLQHSNEVNLWSLLSFNDLILLVVFLIFAGIIYQLLKSEITSKKGLAAALFIIFSVDAINGSTEISLFKRDTPLIDSNISSSAIFTTISPIFSRHQKGDLAPIVKGEANTKLIPAWAEEHPGMSFLIIIVESMGLPVNSAARQWLFKQLNDSINSADWKLELSSLEFKGSTTRGEMRTLCSLTGDYANLNRDNSTNCLPAKLSKIQYETIAIHGFSRRMFNRETWWRIIGFKDIFFANDFNKNTPRCGTTFRGICDDYLIDEAFRMASTPKRFVYLLTLNTHLPLTASELPLDLNLLCNREKIPYWSCQIIAQQGKLLLQIAKILNKYKSNIHVNIVGDHAPPFSDTSDREQFSQTLVPQFDITPKFERH